MEEPVNPPEKGLTSVPGGGETKQNVSAWEVDTLHTHVTDMMGEKDRRYEQRFVSQELRYEQRFQAQEQSVADKFLANEKMVKEVAVLMERALNAALSSQKEAVAAALQSSGLALTKLETQYEINRQQQNEWRGQSKDQTATYATKSEVQQLFAALTDKFLDMSKRMDQAFAASNEKWNILQSRMDRGESKVEGNKQGVSNVWYIFIGVVGAIGGVVGIVSAITAFSR